jgi:hypothetical protein
MTKDPRDTPAEEPDGGNPHVRFRRGPGLSDRPGLLNKRKTGISAVVFTFLPLLFGCGYSLTANQATLKAGVSGLSHGTWVYRLNDLIGSDADAQDLGGFATHHGISDIYLSVSQAAMGNPGLPRFIAGLAEQRLQAEALMGEPTWSDPNERYRMFDRINQIIAYNSDSARTDAEKFLGIHLDIEPWIGSGEDLSWLPDLIDTYRDAAAAIEGTGLSLGADMNGSKIRRAEQPQRQEVLDAAGQLVLMQYETSFSQVEAQTRQFLDGLTPGTAGIFIAIRVQDFGCGVDGQLAQLDDDFASEPAYLGWALFDYGHYVEMCGL